MADMPDNLGKAEIRKDALQDGVSAASQAVGSVTTIVTTAVGGIAKALGGSATEIFEIRDAARKTGRDHLDVVPYGAGGEVDVADLEGPPNRSGTSGQPKGHPGKPLIVVVHQWRCTSADG